jgi:hypothetical protein
VPQNNERDPFVCTKKKIRCTFQNHSRVIFSLDFFPLVRVFLNASKTGREALCVVRDERRQRIRSERDSQRDGLLR